MWLDSERSVSKMRGREDSLHRVIRKQTAYALILLARMLVPTDRRLSYHSGLAVTLSTATE